MKDASTMELHGGSTLHAPRPAAMPACLLTVPALRPAPSACAHLQVLGARDADEHVQSRNVQLAALGRGHGRRDGADGAGCGAIAQAPPPAGRQGRQAGRLQHQDTHAPPPAAQAHLLWPSSDGSSTWRSDGWPASEQTTAATSPSVATAASASSLPMAMRHSLERRRAWRSTACELQGRGEEAGVRSCASGGGGGACTRGRGMQQGREVWAPLLQSFRLSLEQHPPVDAQHMQTVQVGASWQAGHAVVICSGAGRGGDERRC